MQNKFVVIFALGFSVLSGCASMPMLGKQSVKILDGATVVTDRGERYYFGDGGHIFDGKKPSDLRKFNLVSEIASITGYVGTGYGIYDLGADNFRFFMPLSSSLGYIGEYGIVSIGDYRLLKKDTIKENGLSWEVFYICKTDEDDASCRKGWGGQTWNVTHGDIFSLKREEK